MRSSDWSSDVCSSDLLGLVNADIAGANPETGAEVLWSVRLSVDDPDLAPGRKAVQQMNDAVADRPGAGQQQIEPKIVRQVRTRIVAALVREEREAQPVPELAATFTQYDQSLEDFRNAEAGRAQGRDRIGTLAVGRQRCPGGGPAGKPAIRVEPGPRPVGRRAERRVGK